MPHRDDLIRLHAELGLKRLSPVWAKLEILFGLLTAGAGLLYGVRLAASPILNAGPFEWLAPLLLFTLGGYLALAGHRSHLYQSNSRLAAYLAGLIRRSQEPGATS
jgi:hypothetical protein